ncbi:MAG: arsenate reductase [Erythrobacter sp.]
MSIHFYGIPNCDTVRKARIWLEGQGLEHVFHDYRKEGADPAKLAAWIEARGLDAVLNRRGTTFRKLTEDQKAGIDTARAVALMVEQPGMIKRPVVEYPGGLLVGFDADAWAAALG